jgi:hypothetical protein
MIQPQATPQAQPPQMAPQQPQAPQQAPAQPAPQQPPQGQPAPSNGKDAAPLPPHISQVVEQHLNSVPPEQQQFIAKYMTPELAVIFGILLGQGALDYFKRFADPQKQLTVTPRQTPPNGQTGAAPTGQPSAPAMQPQSQPQATPPAASIMGR